MPYPPSMTHAERTTKPLTPEDRRDRLRAFADRMLLGLEKIDDPETGEDIEKGIRRALMIERLYARIDAAEVRSNRHAVEVTPRRDTQRPAGLSVALPVSVPAPTQSEIAARALVMKPQPATSRQQIEGMLQMLEGLMSEDEIEALLTAEDDDTS
ncbi:hypothetical protein [Asticcacaulis sp. AND118]|uniref:hypothetical protein n=1 Tax=Asticcacaulis sp. AND118 TaxID=2840468 RepID=UPI001CFFEED8|nr:hypothetical protein [Asticcacaulis sp. AND118]UDF03778.1 hypothetical protein LH365_01680 [Asticcacaulis sp. AND118]